MKRYFFALFLVMIAFPSYAGAAIIINEVDADNDGVDTQEFIELFDGGNGNTSLDGLVVVLYNGSTDLVYNSFDLSGYATSGAGYFVLGGQGMTSDFTILADSWLQNGADGIALYQGSAADFPIGNPLITSNLIDAFVYGTNDADDAGLLQLLNPGQPQVNEDQGGNAVFFSSQRYPNGEGGARNTMAYYQAPPTPGFSNGGTSSVPLPSSVILLLSGTVGLVSVKRKKVI